MAGQLSAESSLTRGHAAKDTLDENAAVQLQEGLPGCHQISASFSLDAGGALQKLYEPVLRGSS